MSRPVPRHWVIALVALVATALVAAAAVALPDTLERPRRPALSVKQQGAVTGLYPGRTATARVVVRNTSKRPVRLRGVTARPRAAAGCPASMLRAGSVRTSQVLRPGRRTTVRVRVQLLRRAPDSCQGRTFRLALRATARPLR